MARYTFTMSLEQFTKALGPNAKQVLAHLGDADDPIGHAFSCLKAGWLSKMYHKDSQDKRNGEVKVLRQLLKADPDLKKRLEARANGKA